MSITKSELSLEDVMVRGFGNEPVRLTVKSQIGPHTLEVFGTDPEKSVGCAVENTFRFDDELYRCLQKAYQDGNADRLKTLWVQAEPIFLESTI